MEKEIWKDVVGYYNYEVSNLGNVKNKKTNRILTQKIGRDGRYLSVYLSENGKENTKTIHRLVAEAFLGPHPNLVVNHKDGNKLNNALNNLEWCTVGENNRHAVKNGLNHPGVYQKKPVKIIETGEIFDGVVECATAIDADFRNVYRSLNNDKHYATNGLHFEYTNDKPTRRSFLRDHQLSAVKQMFNGCILNGGVGSGKSRTALSYYYIQNEGDWSFLYEHEYVPMNDPPLDLYIITTAKKRDAHEWEEELSHFLLSTYDDINLYSNKVIIDSWNNIQKYTNVSNAFFIFDEDRVTGNGVWVKTFLKISKSNKWILLSATPGDTWLDYIPVFIANGFYKNKTDFTHEHIIYSRFARYPKIDRYVNTRRLERLRDKILIDMDFERKTTPHHEDVYVKYDISKYKDMIRSRWNPYTDKPIKQASEFCYTLRRIVNSDETRVVALMEIVEKHPRVIIFYNFDYELDILKGIYYGEDVEIAEWNGHKHQPVPEGDRWIYLVQYNAGAEGWNCIRTDTIVFYSQNYSYKIVAQACGRIDRLNTPYKDLYYYHLKSRSGIDLAISKALRDKKKFNERKWSKWD